MIKSDTITTLRNIAARSTDQTEIAALYEVIDFLTGVAFRTRTLNMALDCCEGRRKTDLEEAYDADTIVEQARHFENYLLGTT